MSDDLIPSPGRREIQPIAFRGSLPQAMQPYGERITVTVDEPPKFGSLTDYARLLWSRKWLLLGVATLGALVGWIIAEAQTKYYRASAVLEFYEVNENLLGTHELSPVNPAGKGDAYLETQLTILQNPALLRRAVEALHLPDVPPPPRSPGWWRRLGDALGWVSKPVRMNSKAYAAAFAQHLKVRRLRDSNVVELSVEWPDPDVASRFVNQLANEYMLLTLEKRGSLSEETSRWLSGKLSELRERLVAAEDALRRYVEQTGLTVLDETNEASEVKLRELQAELARAQADRIEKQSRYELAMARPANSLPEVLDSGPMKEYVTRLAELRRQYAELTQALTPAHYKVKRLAAQIEELESVIQQERENIVRRIRNEYDAALRRERLLAEQYEQQRDLVARQAGKLQQYKLLKAEVDSQRALYQSMLERVNQFHIASGLAGGNVFMIQPGESPRLPSRPRTPWYVAIGFVVGGILATSWLLVRAHSEATFDSPTEAARYLRTRELGVIPSAKAGLVRVGASAGANSAGNGKKALEASLAVADSFRSALASILFSLGSRSGSGLVLVVTSSAPEEGKTTAVVNLGVALAEMHRRVVVLDADFRKPALHRLIGLDSSWGLSDLLTSENAWVGPPADIAADGPASTGRVPVRETAVKNLFAIPAGPGTVEVTELIYSPRWPELLRDLRQQFDAVLIDTPPLLNVPDARWVARLSDGVILVVRAGRTPRELVRNAWMQLAEDGTSLLGVILNDWNPSTDRYGSPYYTKYYRKYYKGT